MKPTKDLITRIKKLRDTDGLNFRQISEHLKEVDKLDITRQSAERIYKTNPDVKVWSKWSLFVDQWKQEIEAGASINEVAKEYGVRPKVVWYQMNKIGVVSTAKSGLKIKKKEGITMKKFFNVTSHVMTETQIADAKASLGIEEAVNMSDDLKKIWGQVPPTADTVGVKGHIQPVLDWLDAQVNPGDYCMVAGSRTAVAFVDLQVRSKAHVVESCTERKVREVQNPDGTVTKTAVFEHIRYRIVPM